MLWPTSCEGNAGDTRTRGGKNNLPPGSYWNLWRILLQMMGLLLAGHVLLRKAITGWSFEAWVTPAVLLNSGTFFRKLLDNVISVVIQINYRLNICIGNLSSWLYFLTVLSTFLNWSCSEDTRKQIFVGNSIEKLQTTCQQLKFLCLCLYFFAEVTYAFAVLLIKSSHLTPLCPVLQA